MSAIIISGEEIRRTRKARGMTRDAVAKELGVASSAIGHWENGRNGPSRDAALRIAAWLAEKQDIIGNPRPEAALQSLTVTLPAKLSEVAEDLGVNLADLYATTGTEAVRKELTRLWREANAEAIRQHNAYIEKNGIPLSDMRVW